MLLAAMLQVLAEAPSPSHTIVSARAQEASQIRLRQQDNSATWDYVGDSDPDPSAHGGTASEGSGRGGDGNGATDAGDGADGGNGANGDGSEGAQ